jgi:hypothetical protein
MGANGVSKARNGKKIWFLATNNTVVQATVKLMIIRTVEESHRDYTLFLFDKDLPESIQPIPAVASTNLSAKFPYRPGAPWPVVRTEQGGNIGLGLPGFSTNVWKGGDSGSPDLLVLNNELVFIGGRSSSGASPEMQRDLNILCRIDGLDPDNYQLRQVDFSAFPSY